MIKRTPTAALADALSESRDVDVRASICYALGRRCDSEAVPALINRLHDRSGRVCTEAAEALGNIGDRRAGPALLERFLKPGRCSRNMLAYALGVVGYQPAVPALLEALAEPDLRGSAAISLGCLGAVPAKTAMEAALRATIDNLSERKLIERALGAITVVDDALRTGDIAAVLSALDSRDVVLRQAAVRALAMLGGKQAEELLQISVPRVGRDCALGRRISEALDAITKPHQEQP
jgi:HEAT repeat protein